MFDNNNKLVSASYKVFEFFSAAEFLRFNTNSRDLFFRDFSLLNGFSRENPVLIEQIKGNLRWLFSLNALKVEFSGSDASKFFKSLNFFFSIQSRLWNQYYGGQFFFLQNQVRVQTFSNFSAIGVFFKVVDASATNKIHCLSSSKLVRNYKKTGCVLNNDKFVSGSLKIYRNPFFFKFAARDLAFYSDYFNVGFDNILNLQPIFNNFSFFFNSVWRDLQPGYVAFCVFLPYFRNLFIQLTGVIVNQTKLLASFDLPVDLKVYTRLTKNLVMPFFLEFVHFSKLGFFLWKWVYYFKKLILFLEVKGKLISKQVVSVGANIVGLRYLFFKNKLVIPVSEHLSNLFRFLVVKDGYLAELGQKNGRYAAVYWAIRIKNIDVDLVWKIFFRLRRKFWWHELAGRLVSGGFYVYKFTFSLVGGYAPPPILFSNIVFNLRFTGAGEITGYVNTSMFLNLVHDLFYVAVSVGGLAKGSGFFYKRFLSELVNGKLIGGGSLKDAAVYSETRLANFYAFNNFSNYEYFRVTLLQRVRLNQPYVLSVVIRYFRALVIKRVGYLNLLQYFLCFSDVNDLPVGASESGTNRALLHFFRMCTVDIGHSVYFGDSFYKLLFSVRHTRNFYSGLPENEIFYSPSQGILHLVRAGVSRMQYNFFFLYSFLERKANIGFFQKVGGVSKSNSLRFASGLKKFDSSFFNNISANMLSGFSELSALGMSDTRKLALSSKQFDVSKFFFLDEFSDSSFFNNFSSDIILMNFSLLGGPNYISYLLNNACCWTGDLTLRVFEKLMFLKLKKWGSVSLLLNSSYGGIKLRCLFFEI